ncbi:MAG: helix-turn-helix transcriptional regulator, partial [Bacteroidales bacterium]|nr:helix-turn-helix transcriptional regulator [Bacteroidales bacterium]
NEKWSSATCASTKLRKNHFFQGKTICKKIAANIKRVRLKQNMSQLELADKSGVSVSSIKRMEDGELKNFESIIRVLRTLGMLDIFIPLVEEEQLSPNEYYELANKISKRKRKRASNGYVKDKKEEFEW